MRIQNVFLFVLFLLCGSVRGQNGQIEQILSQVHLDSLLFNAESLTGIRQVDILGTPRSIVTRHKDELGNEWAGIYLRSRLEAYGYTVQEDIFSPNGKNYYAVKTGSTFPKKAYMICAHYDAIAIPFSEAVGGDDNASGCAGVLEAARVLKDVNLPYTLIFAFWDEEEQGLFGSDAFVKQFDFDQLEVEAVFNLDMIANDRNNDMRAELHAQDYEHSLELVQRMKDLNDTFSVGLDLEIRNPGTTASDHASFWNADVTAMLLIEDKQDFNPYYHTKFDSTRYFNDSFFYRNTKLAIACLSWFASQTTFTLHTKGSLVNNTASFYPNPAEDRLHLHFEDASRFELWSTSGKMHYKQSFEPGDYLLPTSSYPKGVYLVIINNKAGTLQRKWLILQ